MKIITSSNLLKTLTLVMLTYILIHTYNGDYSVKVNENNVASKAIVNIIESIPWPSVVIILLMVIVIIGIIKEGVLAYIGYGIGLVIIEIGIKIGLDELSLIGESDLFLVTLIHPINIESKVWYLENAIQYWYASSPILNTYDHDRLITIKKLIENTVDYTKLAELNAEGITEYSRELVNNAGMEQEKLSSYVLQIISVLLTLHYVRHIL